MALAHTGGSWPATALGAVLTLVGLTLLAGGVYLASIGGSWYYLFAGIGLTASGWFLIRGRAVGAWIYIAVFAFTVLWALSEAQLDGWALLPRLLGPFVLLLLVIFLWPALDTVRGRRRRNIGIAAWIVVALAGAGAIGAASGREEPAALPSERLTMSDPSLREAGADWPAYGATYAARRYSPLTQITPQNVSNIERAWTYRTGDTPDEDYGAETTPIKIGDTLYLCSARNILIALNAETGEERWRHDPQVSDDYIPYTAACRGVAYFEAPQTNLADGCQQRIIEGTLDARLIAVDARTGAPCAGFGDNGSVSITEGMGEVVPGMVSITSPPVVVRGVVVTGHQVLDGQKLDAPSGVIQAFDAVTGELRWAWDMTNPEWRGAPPEGEIWTRGTPNMWTMATGDEELGLVYLPMGNSAVDYLSSTRTAEENAHATALVALDIETGRPRWVFQTVYMDVWDYDLGSQPTLIDFPGEDGATPAVLLSSKQGEIYVLDRRTGEPLHGVQERRVPQGGVEPDQRTATQPFSAYHTLRRPNLRERDMWGVTPIDQMICRIQYWQAAYEGVYTPPTTARRWIQYPGYNGGSDWGGVAVDPVRGVIIANYNDMPNYNRLIPRAVADERGWTPRGEGESPRDAGDPQAGAPYAIDVNAGWRLPFTGLLCKQPPYGGIRAIDLRTGATIWDRPLGTARRNGPFGIPSMLPFDIGTPNNGGAVITASGLIFIAAATDNLIRAIDIETGETVWQANPMIYEAGGRQYLVIVAAGHHFMETPAGDYVIGYALPERS